MYSVGSDTAFFNIYKELGKHNNLPVLINKQLLEMVGLSPDLNIDEGDLVIDNTFVGEFQYFEKRKLSDFYRNTLENLPSGVNLILIHPAFDNDEMKGITINHPNFGSEWRQLDFDFFTNEENKILLEQNNIQLITWSDIENSLK